MIVSSGATRNRAGAISFCWKRGAVFVRPHAGAVGGAYKAPNDSPPIIGFFSPISKDADGFMQRCSTN